MVIYFDHAATTPMRAEARDAWLRTADMVGNPHSIHSAGRAMLSVVEEAREQIAAVVDATPVEVLFTSGGTEAINTAIKGLYWSRQRDQARPIILAPGGEHHATSDTIEWLEQRQGAHAIWLPVDEHARIDLTALDSALREHGDRVALLSLIWANNEVGTVQPVAEAARLAAEYGVPTHSDAVAALGSVPVRFGGTGLAAMSVSGHKVGGPVGTGALLLRRDVTVEPLLHGGGQQRRLRSGTVDAASVAAFAAATVAAVQDLEAHAAQLRALRDRTIAGIRELVPDAVLRGADPGERLDGGVVLGAVAAGEQVEGRVPGNVHVTIPGVDGESLQFLLDAAGFAVSQGSACTAGVAEASTVLLAMGCDEVTARAALRITFGAGNTIEQVDAFLDALPEAVERARAASR